MRRKAKIKHTTSPDPIYESVLVERFTNRIMYDGKKSTARKVMYDAFEILKQKTKTDDPLKVLDLAIRNAMAEKLSEEILAASRGEGSAIKKRDDTHKMAEANRAFAHFAW